MASRLLAQIPPAGSWSLVLDVREDGSVDVFSDWTDKEMGRPVCLVDCRDFPDDEDSPPREVALRNGKMIAALPNMARALVEAIAQEEARRAPAEQFPWLEDARAALRLAGILE